MLNKYLQAAAGNAAEPLFVESVFSTYLYTGNSSTQTITNGIDLAGEGGMVWIKNRGDTDFHNLFDTNRGAGKVIFSNDTSAEFTQASRLSSFTTSGFTLGDQNQVNETGYNYASWTFRKAEKFFDVVTYTGTGTTRSIAHNLGSTPACIIIRSTSANGSWSVWHSGIHSTSGSSTYLRLNETFENRSFGATWISSINDSTFTVNNGYGSTNSSGVTYVAYLFASDAGGFGDDGTESIIKCGSYTGVSTGVNVNLGFEAQWVIIKNITNTSDWFIADIMRGMYQDGTDPIYRKLVANTSGAEADFGGPRPTSTGFVTKGGGTTDNGDTYIYIAIRRGPMKTPESGTEVFAPVTQTGGSFVTTNFPVDLLINKWRNTTGQPAWWVDRLRGAGYKFLRSDGTDAEDSYATNYFPMDHNTGVEDDWNGSGSQTYWNFRRAPGFFDVVCYTGTGSGTHNVSHNLGAKPLLVICKSRSTGGTGYNWPAITDTSVSSSATLFLNTSSSNNGGSSSGMFTDTTVNVGSSAGLASLYGSNQVNASGVTYVMYLFATVAGVSKVGSYTGTGTTKQIDCGFSSGARFVLIKRTNSTGDWYVWDSARGIVAGNDSYLTLNSTAAEVTTTDWVDPYSAGFELSSAAGNNVNINGASYIFLSVA